MMALILMLSFVRGGREASNVTAVACILAEELICLLVIPGLYSVPSLSLLASEPGSEIIIIFLTASFEARPAAY